jgi:hypothetical protein
MAFRLTREADTVQRLWNAGLTAALIARLRPDNVSSNGNSTHYMQCRIEETGYDSAARVLSEISTGAANVYAVKLITNAPPPRLQIQVGASNVLNVDLPAGLKLNGAVLEAFIRLTKHVSTPANNTFSVRAYIDGALVATASGAIGAATAADPTAFNWTNRFALSSGNRNVRGVHTQCWRNDVMSDAECDAAVALRSPLGAALHDMSKVVYIPPGIVCRVGNSSTTDTARPGMVIGARASNDLIHFREGESNPWLISATGLTLVGDIQFVDPFADGTRQRQLPATALTGAAPAGSSVGPANAVNSPLMFALAAGHATSVFNQQIVVIVLANSRISHVPSKTTSTSPFVIDRARVEQRRRRPGNIVDYGFPHEFGSSLVGRINCQPQLDTNNGGLAFFDCFDEAPLYRDNGGSSAAAATAAKYLFDSPAARFGTGSRAAGGASPTYQGSGDPLLLNAGYEQRMSVKPELGLSSNSDAIVLEEIILNFPNSSAIERVRPEASATQGGAATFTGTAQTTGFPTLGTAMSGVAFASFNAGTLTIGVDDTGNALATAAVGQMLEFVNSDGTSIQVGGGDTTLAPEISVVSAITGKGTGSATVVLDRTVRTAATIAASPGNFRIKWCDATLHKVTCEFAGNESLGTTGAFRGIALKAANSGSGLIIMSVGVRAKTKPGVVVGPAGWSGRGWQDQLDTACHVVGSDGKTPFQRFWALLSPNLCVFTVANQGNVSGTYDTLAATYHDRIVAAVPGIEFVFAAEGAHMNNSASTAPNAFADGQTFPDHSAAMRKVAIEKGRLYISNLLNRAVGTGIDQFLAGNLSDDQHPLGIDEIRGWMQDSLAVQRSLGQTVRGVFSIGI